MRTMISIYFGVLTLATADAAYCQISVLGKITEEVRAAYNKQERPIVVFDLEGTLLDNRPRTLRILQEFAKSEIKTARPEAAERLAMLTAAMMQYRLTDTLTAVGVTEEGVVNNAAVYWAEKFFTDDYLKYDAPVPGAVAYVRSLYSIGARIVYVTGRDQARQLIGTVRALRDNGFPVGIFGSELIMKPTAEIQDPIFKQQVTTYLRNSGKVIATFDSEPSNINAYRRALADTTCVLFSAPRAPNPPPLLPNIVTLTSFQ
jgi:hypothetical protein